jgi:hypothetical protein
MHDCCGRSPQGRRNKLLDRDLVKEYAIKLELVIGTMDQCTIGFLPHALHQSNQYLTGK